MPLKAGEKMKNETVTTTDVRPHEADGIQECDNPLPRWWVGLFIACVVYAFIYLVYFHVMDRPDHLELYNVAMAERKALLAKESEGSGGEGLEARLASVEYAEAGKEHFTTNCVVCHKENGEGSIGPNLTDNFWIHGGTAADIIRVLEEGVLEKGMPPWKDVLGRKKIEQLTALILTWRGKNLTGKAAQGDPYSP